MKCPELNETLHATSAGSNVGLSLQSGYSALGYHPISADLLQHAIMMKLNLKGAIFQISFHVSDFYSISFKVDGSARTQVSLLLPLIPGATV